MRKGKSYFDICYDKHMLFFIVLFFLETGSKFLIANFMSNFACLDFMFFEEFTLIKVK